VSEPQRRTDGGSQSTCSGVIGKPQKRRRYFVPRRSQSLCLVMPAALGGSNTIAGRCLSEMPRYFFHVRRGIVTVFDREGVELTGIAEAKPRGGDVRSRHGMLRLAPASALVESSSKKDGAPSWNCHSDRLPAVHRRCDVGAPLAQRPSVSMAPAVRVASRSRL
jgi:hypothetical protein